MSRRKKKWFSFGLVSREVAPADPMQNDTLAGEMPVRADSKVTERQAGQGEPDDPVRSQAEPGSEGAGGAATGIPANFFFTLALTRPRLAGPFVAVWGNFTEGWRPAITAILLQNCSSPNAEKFCRIGTSTEH